jgi:hypothetical protein
VRLRHDAPVVRATFDDPNLVSCAGLVPVMRLAQTAGLYDAVAGRVRLPGDKGANPAGKVATIAAGMLAGADTLCFVDIDSMLRRVYGKGHRVRPRQSRRIQRLSARLEPSDRDVVHPAVRAGCRGWSTSRPGPHTEPAPSTCTYPTTGPGRPHSTTSSPPSTPHQAEPAHTTRNQTATLPTTPPKHPAPPAGASRPPDRRIPPAHHKAKIATRQKRSLNSKRQPRRWIEAQCHGSTVTISNAQRVTRPPPASSLCREECTDALSSTTLQQLSRIAFRADGDHVESVTITVRRNPAKDPQVKAPASGLVRLHKARTVHPISAQKRNTAAARSPRCDCILSLAVSRPWSSNNIARRICGSAPRKASIHHRAEKRAGPPVVPEPALAGGLRRGTPCPLRPGHADRSSAL